MTTTSIMVHQSRFKYTRGPDTRIQMTRSSSMSTHHAGRLDIQSTKNSSPTSGSTTAVVLIVRKMEPRSEEGRSVQTLNTIQARMVWRSVGGDKCTTLWNVATNARQSAGLGQHKSLRKRVACGTTGRVDGQELKCVSKLLTCSVNLKE
jgi:hypothetical protein